ncbi:intracellular multiplication protein IcmL [Bradyrhizobium sp. USDA 4341]
MSVSDRFQGAAGGAASAVRKIAGRPAGRAEMPVSTHQDEAVATTLSRQAYARERYELLLRTLYGLLMLLGVSLLLNFWLALRPVEIKYFATDSLGQIRSLTALDRPIQSKGEVVNWTTNAITQAFTFGFSNYRESFEVSKLNFTDSGWRGFQQAVEARKILADVIENKYVTSSALREAPVVSQEGIVDGRWGWKIEIPMLVTYESASAHQTVGFIAEVIVVRRPESENPSGLGIAQILAK